MMIRILLSFVIVMKISLVLAENNDVKYTQKEKVALKEFYKIVKDELYRDFMKKDEYLIHWLRERDLDPIESQKILINALLWRKSNKIDGILNEEKMNRIEKYMPYNFETVDKEGRPILGFQLGKWDVRKHILKGMQDDLKRYQNYLLEKSMMKVIELNNQNENKTISQYIHIVDLNGYSLRTHGCLACVPVYTELVFNYQFYYPNSAFKIISINVNRTFENLLQLLLPLMKPNLRNTMLFYGYNKDIWTSELSQFIPKETLPKIFRLSQE